MWWKWWQLVCVHLVIYQHQQLDFYQKLSAEQLLPCNAVRSVRAGVADHPSQYKSCQQGHSPPAKLGRMPCCTSSLLSSALCFQGGGGVERGEGGTYNPTHSFQNLDGRKGRRFVLIYFNPFSSITPSKPLMSSGSWLTMHNCEIFYLLAVIYDPVPLANYLPISIYSLRRPPSSLRSPRTPLNDYSPVEIWLTWEDDPFIHEDMRYTKSVQCAVKSWKQNIRLIIA